MANNKDSEMSVTEGNYQRNFGKFDTRQNGETKIVFFYSLIQKSIERGIPVMTERWIEAIWEANVKEFVRFDDSRFDQYKCPVFMNLIVTSTNLSKHQKEAAKKAINENGGVK